MNYSPAWRERLYDLLQRFPHCGIEADISEASETALWGVYRFLSRLDEARA